MAAVRAVLVAITILVLAIAPSVVSDGSGSTGGQAAYAASAIDGATSARQATPTPIVIIVDNGNGNGNKNDNGGDNGNGNGNDNGGDNGNGNDNDDDDDDNGNGNDNDFDVPDPILVPQPGGTGGTSVTGRIGGGATNCTVAGQESVFTSNDGRVAVRVFGNQGGIRLMIGGPVDLNSVPAAPGPRVDAFVYRINAERCDGTVIQTLGSEVNLGIRYSDADAGSLNEQNFRLAILDPAIDQWKDFEKQAPDPGANYISATVMEVGYITVYQRS